MTQPKEEYLRPLLLQRAPKIVEGEPKGFFKLAENMVASSLQKTLEQDQELLKHILEKG
ncbi:MAG: hypothetical protein HPY72_11555 [Anaerolineae bacterium]|nr:hypothetical protein [Anaerolineae bacterium]